METKRNKTTEMGKGMGIEFLDRSLRTTSLVLLVFLPFGFYYFGLYPTLAIFSGGVWGIVNLVFTSALVRVVFSPGDANKGRAIGLSLVKFPMLYAAGFALLSITNFSPTNLLAGFSLMLVVIVLKSLGRIMLNLDDSSEENNNIHKATHPA